MSASAAGPTTGRPGRHGLGLLTVAALGHRGLGITADALGAGFHVTCTGPCALRVRRLITELSAGDALAATLLAGLRAGTLSFAEGPPRGAAVDVAVFVPGGDPAGQSGPGSVERAAAGLAPAVWAGTHVVLVGAGGLLAHADVVAGTIGMLTGREAGRDYSLGFAVVSGVRGAPAVLSGDDAASVRRTESLFCRLGRPTTTVTPPAAAEFVAGLQRALLGAGPAHPDPR